MRRLAAITFALACFSLVVEGQPAGTLLVRHGRVIDGSGGPSRQVDVRIAGDTIVEVAPQLTPGDGEIVVDAANRVVAPGFVDMHSHADGGLVDRPDALSQIQQGITTALVGQDGGGDLPVSDFLERIDSARPAINVATSVGHGTVRGLVLGADFKRAATDGEIAVMRALVDRAMKDGAVGLSSGLEYDPGFYAQPAELVALASALSPFGGVYSSHVRDEENEVVAAWNEAIDVGRRAKVAVEISHMKVAAKAVWGKAGEALAVIDAAVREGLDVGGDWYPYPYWQSSMYVLIPDRDFENVEKWRLGLDEIGGAQNVLITSYSADATWNGRTLAELAAHEKIDPPALIVRMVKTAGPNIGIIGTSMDEGDMRAIFAHPRVLICSDGQLSGRHPRGYNAFPRVLARYVRDAPRRSSRGSDCQDDRPFGSASRVLRSRHHRRRTQGRSRRLRSRCHWRSRHAAGTGALAGRHRYGRGERHCGARQRQADRRATRSCPPSAPHQGIGEHIRARSGGRITHALMAPALVRAEGALLEELFDQTYPLWGEGLSRRAYAQWNTAQEQTEWGRTHLRRLALVDNGRVLASAKRYDLTLVIDGRHVPTVGVGAVFTPVPMRGRGYARAIIDALVDTARGDGAEFALLFSEIGAAYYQRLGFTVVPVETADLMVLEKDGAPAMLVRAGEAADAEQVAAIHARRAAQYRLSLASSPDQVRYTLTKKRLFAGLDPSGRRTVEPSLPKKVIARWRSSFCR